MNQPLLVIGLTLAVCASQAQTLEQASVKRGMTLYDSRCFGCHSVDAHRVDPMNVNVPNEKIAKIWWHISPHRQNSYF
jgi:mono/diheme cytochrome c family protein